MLSLKGPLLRAAVLWGLRAGAGSAPVKNIGLRVAAAALAALGGLFVLIALHQWLAAELGRIAANMIFAALFLVAAGVVWWLAERRRRPRLRPLAGGSPLAPIAPLVDDIARSGRRAMRSADHYLAQNSGKLLIAAVALGAFLGTRRSRPDDHDG